MNPDTYAIMTVIWAAALVISIGLVNLSIVVGSSFGAGFSFVVWLLMMKKEWAA